MVSHDEYLALRQRAGIVNRSNRGRLRLTGADRRSYLQGLLTNDIAALGAGSGCYAALLTPQGRMIADMRVFETGNDILIDLSSAAVARVSAHLTDFIFSEDVTVQDVTASMLQWGVYGPTAGAVLATMLASDSGAEEPAPSAAELDGMAVYANARWTFRGAPVLAVRSDDIGVRGFDLFVEAPYAGDLGQSLAEYGGMVVGDDAVEVCRIETGRPLFGVDMDEDTIPLEAGIEDRAISLTKGCYVGQEIIIRVLHRGHGRVARRLVGMTLDTGGGVPPRGAPVKSGDREIGRLTSAAHSPALGRPIALGYVHRDFTAPGTIVAIGGESGDRPATIVEVPFV